MKENKPEYNVSLETTGFSKRRWSWILFLLVLGLFLIFPMLSLVNEDAATVLRSSPLPSDNSWISGHLSPAHQIPDLNQNCEACHVAAFEVVQDQACLTCHADTSHHFDTSVHDVKQLEGARCASCHIEHDEPVNIISQNDALCVDCHANMADSGAVETKLNDVATFGAESAPSSPAPHPTFNVSMEVGTGKLDALEWTLERFALNDQPLEQSNLIFPHDVHMNAQGIDAPDGLQVLACNDCHITDDAGKLMQPVTMENNCRSCHTLVFDADFPDREVPHGNPDTVLLTLEEFYSRQFLRASLGRNPTPQEVRDFKLRRPGKSVQARGEQALSLDSPWGKANAVAQEIFTQTTCKTCHEVTIHEGSEYLSKWRVEPIKLTKSWMPKSSFDHYSHRTTDCTVCHKATTSEQSSDVLMPDLPVCEACHTDVRSHANKVPSSCVSCHQFHLPDQLPWEGELGLSAAHQLLERNQNNTTPKN